MMSFRNARLRNLAVPLGTSWLLNDIAEAKGRQELYLKQKPQILQALRTAAVIQSVESSNRIEGITVAPDRLEPLVLGGAVPRDRSEEEIAGYRRAIDLVETLTPDRRITPDLMRHLHALCHEGAGDAGAFKRIDNQIVELRPDGPPVVRFNCVLAAQTPTAIDELLVRYQYAVDQEHILPLIASAALILDFLCIHPFRDGNGRVSRLLTTCELYRFGYEAGRYLSLERLIEESKEEYYKALALSSHKWHEEKHDLLPWLNYYLTIIRRAYREFENRAGQVTMPRGAKVDLVIAAVKVRSGEFRIREIEQDCPGVGREWIRTILADLKEQGIVICNGKGPAARWRYLSSEGSNP